MIIVFIQRYPPRTLLLAVEEQWPSLGILVDVVINPNVQVKRTTTERKRLTTTTNKQHIIIIIKERRM